MLKKAVNWEDDKSATRIKLREDNFVRYDGDTPVIVLYNIDYMIVEDEMEKVSDNYLFEIYFLDGANNVVFNDKSILRVEQPGPFLFNRKCKKRRKK